MPSVDALRGAVAQLAEDAPHSRFTWSLDPGKRFWQNDRTAESVVVERDWPEDSDFGSRLRSIAEDPSITGPLNLIRYPNHIGLKMCHAVGDGRMFIAAFCAPMYAALLGTAVEWPIEPSPRFPLMKALLRTFGRHPSAIRDAFADRPQFAEEAHGGEERPWQPSQITKEGVLGEPQLHEIYAWRSRHAPGASVYAIQIALILSAMKESGLRLSADVRMIADLRRYLGWKSMSGNFVAGVPMAIDPQMPATQVSSLIKATNTSARPLAGYANVAAHRLRGVTGDRPSTVVADALPRISFSSVGKPPALDGLPFLPGRPVDFTGSVVPDGPLGITVLLAETSRSMNIAITFHDNVVDPGVIERALRIIEAGPVALLERAEGNR
ncbi:Uncharacterised protein [Mycobacteroides abscessus subsp. abscessus]|nr:Uncharacterised protein [Mycobacteroides abscessus subsp. abscessus]